MRWRAGSPRPGPRLRASKTCDIPGPHGPIPLRIYYPDAPASLNYDGFIHDFWVATARLDAAAEAHAAATAALRRAFGTA